ncbi:MAG: hypothetical protein ACK53K_03615 [Burkholderiales bacterium]
MNTSKQILKAPIGRMTTKNQGSDRRNPIDNREAEEDRVMNSHQTRAPATKM